MNGVVDLNALQSNVELTCRRVYTESHHKTLSVNRYHSIRRISRTRVSSEINSIYVAQGVVVVFYDHFIMSGSRVLIDSEKGAVPAPYS